MKRLILFILIFWSIIPQAIAQNSNFQGSVNICPEEIYSCEMVMGDIDNDGDLDLITHSALSPGYYLNDGTGVFGHRVDIYKDYPFQVRGKMFLIDIDTDDDLDLLMSTGGYGKIIMLLNDGSGNFSYPEIISNDDNVVSLEVVDFDQDGDEDILACYAYIGIQSDKIVWYENDGTGQFGAQQMIYEIENWIVTSGDIDNDGDLDILRYRPLWGAYWLENDGEMGFSIDHQIAVTTGNSRSLHLVDLDGDSDLDVFLPEVNNDGAAWYANDGIGNFTLGQSISEFGSMYISNLDDIDNDGDIDVIASFEGDLGMGFFLNNGLGIFSYQATLSTESESGRIIISEDVDNDGDIDIIESWQNDPIFLHKFDSDLVSIRSPLNDFILEPSYCYAADLDGDGDLDALSSSSFDNVIAWYENPGSETSTSWDQIVLTIELQNPNYILSEDLNNDGDMDIIATSGSNGIAPVYMENLGDGTFDINNLPGDWSGNAIIVHLNLNDLDNDGDFDILISLANSNTISWCENLDDGSYAPLVDLIELENWYSTSIEVSDINGDNLKDLILIPFSGDVVWHKNLGSNMFGSQNLIYPTNGFTLDVRAGDFDGDGDNDVISSFPSPMNEIHLYMNDGSGLFICPPTKFQPQYPVSQIVPTDIDLDGDLDILCGGLYNAIYFNEGPNIFERLTISSGINNLPLFPFDMDNDGDLDILRSQVTNELFDYIKNTNGEGCMDEEACNYDMNAFIPSNNCCYNNCGCTDVQAENYNDDADCDDGTCLYQYGCTDTNADNFDPTATADDGSCQFTYGCTDQYANNYDQEASIDDCSCVFDIVGSVFFDSNENGLMDGTEYTLPNQQLVLFPDSLIAYTNEQGSFNFSGFGYGNYEVLVLNDSVFPFNTTDSTQAFSLYQGSYPDLLFGISDAEALNEIDVVCLPLLNPLPCDEQNEYSVRIHNIGNQVLDGSITFTYDSLYNDLSEITPIDSIDEHTVYTSFTNLLPGEIRQHYYGLVTPNFSFIGDTIYRTASVWAWSGSDTLAFGQSLHSNIVECSYDPNDKRVYPEGYGQDHFVHPDSILHYLIRFQNTGNAPAINVIIRDTISADLDLSTIEAVTSSHESFMTVDVSERVVKFNFPDIMLPGSVNNEEESQGFVSFSIVPKNNVPLLTELNNTAEIYFDNNPPIVTNTTWSTLYDCSLFTVDLEDNGAILTASEGDNYQWYLDGLPINGASGQQYVALENGDYSVEIGIDFPCSAITNSTYVVVSSISEFDAEILTLFPNPMTSSAFVNVGNFRGQFQLRIFDASGKIIRQRVLKIENGEVKIDRGELNSGQYYLELTNESDNAKIKFIVQ